MPEGAQLRDVAGRRPGNGVAQELKQCERVLLAAAFLQVPGDGCEHEPRVVDSETVVCEMADNADGDGAAFGILEARELRDGFV